MNNITNFTSTATTMTNTLNDLILEARDQIKVSKAATLADLEEVILAFAKNAKKLWGAERLAYIANFSCSYEPGWGRAIIRVHLNGGDLDKTVEIPGWMQLGIEDVDAVLKKFGIDEKDYVNGHVRWRVKLE